MSITIPKPFIETLDQYEVFFAALKDCSKGEQDLRLRNLYLTDLFALLRYGCNRVDMHKRRVFELCRMVQAEPDNCLDVWHREAYKTTIVVAGLTLFNLLQNSELTFGLISYTRSFAQGTLNQIMREMQGNEHLKALFPDVLYANPEKESPKWSAQDGIIIKRKENPKEASIEAWGLDAMPTGKHFDVLVYDDIVTSLTVTTPDMIAKTTMNWRLSTNLGTVGGATRMCGTIYAFNDTYGEIERSGIMKVRRFPATIDGTEDFSPANCFLMTPEELTKRRREQGGWVFSCQMLLKPQGDTSMGFQRSWLRFADGKLHAEGLAVYITVDPAGSKGKKSDYTAICVIGLGDDGTYRLLDVVRDKLNLSERIGALFSLVRIWRPRAVGYEKVGLQSDTEAIRREQERTNCDFRVIELGARTSKQHRISRLIPLFEQGLIILPRTRHRTLYDGTVVDIIDAFVEQEYLQFPVSEHDDMLDALSRIVDEELKVAAPMGRIRGGGRDSNFRPASNTESVNPSRSRRGGGNRGGGSNGYGPGFTSV